MSSDKYGNIDELLSGSGDDNSNNPTVITRTRRPSPALGVMTGDTSPTSVTDGLKAEKKKAETALMEAEKRFETEKADLLKQLEDANNSTLQLDSKPIFLTMPVTKRDISFKLHRVDNKLIDISPENERIQVFLDEISLQDLLPSIKKHGQQNPGTLRPKENGRFELIEGSRRLAAVKLANQRYLALVGDVPDADVRELGIIENKHRNISPYEKAISYQRQIERGDFDNWTQLGAAKGISSSHIARYKACVELDELFVRILTTPSDMPLSYGETIIHLRKKGDKLLMSKAKELLQLRQTALEDRSDFLDVEDVIKLLKSSVRTKTSMPKLKKPRIYTSIDRRMQVKHSLTNMGAVKFEISGADETQNKRILESILHVLNIEFSER